eukprot:gene8769-21999_t
MSANINGDIGGLTNGDVGFDIDCPICCEHMTEPLVLSVCRAAITIANPATHPVDEALEGIAIALAEEGEYASRLKVQREAIATMLDE